MGALIDVPEVNIPHLRTVKHLPHNMRFRVAPVVVLKCPYGVGHVLVGSAGSLYQADHTCAQGKWFHFVEYSAMPADRLKSSLEHRCLGANLRPL